MRQREKIGSSIASASLALASVALLLVVAFTTAKAIPDNPITDPDHFSQATMLVSPGGNAGQANQSSSQDQSNSDEQPQQEAASSTQSDQSTTPGQSGETGGQGTGGATSTASDKPGTAGEPTADSNLPGIDTNLANFRNVTDETRAPDSSSLTLDGRSGLDRNASTLTFYAKPNKNAGRYSLEVAYSTAASGQAVPLQGDGNLYTVPIDMTDGSIVTVTVTLVDPNGKAVGSPVDFTITYEGRHGPNIATNITDGESVETENFTLQVTASDYYDGSSIYSDHIQVSLDGTQLTDTPSGGPAPYEYNLFLGSFFTGDVTAHTVTVTAWDYNSNIKTIRTYTLNYTHHATGELIGTVTVCIDATTVGLGVIDSVPVDIHEGIAFPEDMVNGLSSLYQVNYSGSFDSGFYLSGLARGGMTSGASVPDILASKIADDGITTNWGNASSDSLSEYDYTAASGWVYQVNRGGSTWWPSTNLSGYVPQDGDVVTLLFTLAYGKDVGNGGGGGTILPSYCGIWIGGGYTESHDISVYTVIKESTCKDPGIARYDCSVEHSVSEDLVDKYGAYGDAPGVCNQQEISLPLTEHQWQLEYTVDPTPTEDGLNHYVCSVCGETKDETIPATGGSSTDPGGGSTTDPGGGSTTDPGGSSTAG